MKKLLKATFIVVMLCFWGSCDSFRSLTGAKKTAQGSPYEVLVVCDGREWESALGEELRATLETPVEMLNQVEPMFNVVRITARDFKHLLPSYRNILKVLQYGHNICLTFTIGKIGSHLQKRLQNP